MYIAWPVSHWFVCLYMWFLFYRFIPILVIVQNSKTSMILLTGFVKYLFSPQNQNQTGVKIGFQGTQDEVKTIQSWTLTEPTLMDQVWTMCGPTYWCTARCAGSPLHTHTHTIRTQFKPAGRWTTYQKVMDPLRTQHGTCPLNAVLTALPGCETPIPTYHSKRLDSPRRLIT